MFFFCSSSSSQITLYSVSPLKDTSDTHPATPPPQYTQTHITSLSTALKRTLLVFLAVAGFRTLLLLLPQNLVPVLLLIVSALILGASPSITKMSLMPIRRREDARKNKLLQKHLKRLVRRTEVMLILNLKQFSVCALIQCIVYGTRLNFALISTMTFRKWDQINQFALKFCRSGFCKIKHNVLIP